jgi:cysteine desulfurase
MFGNKLKRIYCDHASGTAIVPEVFNAMNPYFTESFHNPGSIYKEGVAASQMIEESRKEVAEALRARPSEIVFTDGGTEANNMAILGTVRKFQKDHPEKTAHIVTTKIEHASVIEVCKILETEGVLVTYLSVDENGFLDIKELKESLGANTVLISIGYVNGEIGTIQDIKSVMKIVRHHRKHNQTSYPVIHTDAIQAANYVTEIGVLQLGVDLMTINASKIYGPKKIGVLFVKTGVVIQPIIYGGNQEGGMRSGTENVPYIIGMARSLTLARKLQPSELLRLQELQKYIKERLRHLFPEIIVNAENAETIPNIINLTFPRISHEELVIRLDAKGIMASVKSACKAGEGGDSHVIKAISHSDRPTGSIRFSFGRTTKRKDVEYVLTELQKIVTEMNETYKRYY